MQMSFYITSRLNTDVDVSITNGSHLPNLYPLGGVGDSSPVHTWHSRYTPSSRFIVGDILGTQF